MDPVQHVIPVVCRQHRSRRCGRASWGDPEVDAVLTATIDHRRYCPVIEVVQPRSEQLKAMRSESLSGNKVFIREDLRSYAWQS